MRNKTNSERLLNNQAGAGSDYNDQSLSALHARLRCTKPIGCEELVERIVVHEAKDGIVTEIACRQLQKILFSQIAVLGQHHERRTQSPRQLLLNLAFECSGIALHA